MNSPEYKDLSNDQKLKIIEIMRDSMNLGISQHIQQHCYQYFSAALNGGPSFTPENMWKNLDPRAKSHLPHCIESMRLLDEEEEKIKDCIVIENSSTEADMWREDNDD